MLHETSKDFRSLYLYARTDNHPLYMTIALEFSALASKNRHYYDVIEHIDVEANSNQRILFSAYPKEH
jgi:hypothetical protein